MKKHIPIRRSNAVVYPVAAAILTIACVLASCRAFAAARAWDADMMRDTSPIQIREAWGETLSLTVRAVSNGVPVAFPPGSSAVLLAQTNGMGATAWEIPATISGAEVSAVIAMPSERTRFWFMTKEGGAARTVSLKPWGDLTPVASPGPVPNRLPLPQPVIDFAAVTVLNPPWESMTNAVPETDPVALPVATDALALAQSAAASIMPPDGATIDTDGDGKIRVKPGAFVPLNEWGRAEIPSSISVGEFPRPVASFGPDMINAWDGSEYRELPYGSIATRQDISDALAPFGTPEQFARARLANYRAVAATNYFQVIIGSGGVVQATADFAAAGQELAGLVDLLPAGSALSLDIWLETGGRWLVSERPSAGRTGVEASGLDAFFDKVAGRNIKLNGMMTIRTEWHNDTAAAFSAMDDVRVSRWAVDVVGVPTRKVAIGEGQTARIDPGHVRQFHWQFALGYDADAPLVLLQRPSLPPARSLASPFGLPLSEVW